MSEAKKVLMLLGNYDPATHRGIARAARVLGWHLNVSMLSSFQIPSRWEGDGIICSLDNNKALERFVLQSALPCVDLSAWQTHLEIPRISIDNERIGDLAAEHFCSFGHRSFGWFCHQPSPIATVRFRSFGQGIADRGLPLPTQLTGKRTQDHKAVEAWLAAQPTPTAIFAYNDNDAAWLLNVCLASGYRVPDDFAILGVDNNPLICEHLAVPLSSINHDHERIGYEGAEMLDRIIRGERAPTGIQYIQPTGITLRTSSDALAVSDPIVREALAFLIKHLREPIGTPEVARTVGVSRRKLEMRFQSALKTSVHKKLVELRLKSAETLLRNSDRKIEDISALTGFCHAPHLCRIFKMTHGQSPAAYRKAHKARLNAM